MKYLSVASINRRFLIDRLRQEGAIRCCCFPSRQHIRIPGAVANSRNDFDGIRSFSSSNSSSNIETTTKKKPFDKVLIANRGEIVQRVIRTCRKLGIATVAVYSTADAQAPFVQEADEAICLGPAQASQSYLHTPALVHAIQESGAQAVHPGYGFLSENAQFAETIAHLKTTKDGDKNTVWLGPPAHAILQMGDKLSSKKIAEQAGVTIVPGHEAPLESLEQALQLCQDGIVPYPVLLKAAAGGGGKGMRICFNDQELKEAWTLSKAESLQFFGDDRLLLEKYIENPHHIEFQVMCAPTTNNGTDVVVFPERECSIQRRNQKIIEESPSVMLNEQTRTTMVEQVVRLCQAVGYQSAGTLEFLVDAQQNFYFLEMNTRLQVEHCVSEEAVKGDNNAEHNNIDLAKAMLWIGAGWGFPEEIERARDGHVVRPTRHAIEARIYAEDPTRSFLPSTGPLLPYVEPPTSATLRVDSGVATGHVVTPYYDPMLSKVISSSLSAPNSSVPFAARNEAIQSMKEALDEYVIEGVQHNARLIQAVLRNPAFVGGETPTSFLPTHFPTGFNGVDLTLSEQEEMAVAAVLIDAIRRTLLQQPPLVGRTTTTGMDTMQGQALVVRLGGFFGEAFLVKMVQDDDGTVTVEKLKNQHEEDKDGAGSYGERRTLVLNNPVLYEPSRYLAQVTLDGVSRNIQVIGENKVGELKVQMYGHDTSILVQTPREYELAQYMKPPVEEDTSSLVQSPMPGTLVSLTAQEGDEVEDGQELCIVEAMKMQNIIKSPKQATIAKICVKVGDSLRADQVILEFEP